MCNWPMTKDTSTKSQDAWRERHPQFVTCFKHLLAIDKNGHRSRNTIPDIMDPIMLPVELLLLLLRKRFKYHFYGSKITNTPDKVHSLIITLYMRVVHCMSTRLIVTRLSQLHVCGNVVAIF